MGVRETAERVNRGRQAIERRGSRGHAGLRPVLVSQNGEQLGEHPPRGPGHPRRGLRLEVALHAAVAVDEGAFFFRDVRNRENDLGVAGPPPPPPPLPPPPPGPPGAAVDAPPPWATGRPGFVRAPPPRGRRGPGPARPVVAAASHQPAPPR